METKNPGIIVLAILIVVVAGVVLFGLQGLAATGSITPSSRSITGNGSESLHTLTTTVILPVTTLQGRVVLANPDRAEPNRSYRTVTDMAGRKVTIPVNIRKVIGPKHFVDLIAPEKLAGWQPPSQNESRKYLEVVPDTVPVIAESSTNYEANIALHPDIVFIGCELGITTDPASINLTQEKYGALPAVCVDNIRNATEYGPTIRFIGDVLGVPERADKLLNYYQGVLDEVRTGVSAIPEEKRVRVYYAEGTNGLSTDLSGSCHSQLIDVCGGINVAGNNSVFSSTSSIVTKESVLMWNPDAIITTSPEFIALVYNDSTWQQMPAVKNHRVYLTPTKPYNWFDRPPGMNRIVGIPWTAHVLYPDLFPEDWFRKKVKEFYSLYYQYDLSDEDLSSLISE
ncbi:MAG: ABC transporter substrate-binding protein [Methanoregula sp.]|jgi:iron complex transport system substrate-binding protein